jgi:hypothetical protein
MGGVTRNWCSLGNFHCIAVLGLLEAGVVGPGGAPGSLYNAGAAR